MSVRNTLAAALVAAALLGGLQGTNADPAHAGHHQDRLRRRSVGRRLGRPRFARSSSRCSTRRASRCPAFRSPGPRRAAARCRAATTTTDNDGKSTVKWTLAPTAGNQVVTVTSTQIAGVSVSFVATNGATITGTVAAAGGTPFATFSRAPARAASLSTRRTPPQASLLAGSHRRRVQERRARTRRARRRTRIDR